MTAKIIFNLLIALFAALSVVGIVVGIYSVINSFYIEHSEKWARIASWLFFGGGIACIICIATRIMLGIVLK